MATQLRTKLRMVLTTDIQRAFAEGGPKTVIARSLRRLARPVFKGGSLVFTWCDLTQPFPEARQVPGILVRQATIEDAVLFEDQALFLQRFNQGNRCFMGIEQQTGKLANYRWVNFSRAYIPEIDRYLMLRPWEAYIFDLNTLPEFRRRGIDAQTRHYTYSYVRDMGYRTIFAYIHGDNYPSLMASRHLLEPTGRVWYIQLRGCEPIMIGRPGRNFPDLCKL